MDATKPQSSITLEELDRLVDGALSVHERRALLLRIEAEPEAWRRCGLAFLEAQAWRESFGAMTSPHADEPPPILDLSTRRPRLRLVSSALAAGLAFTAFLLGRATMGPDRPEPAPSAPPAQVANLAPATPLDASLHDHENIIKSLDPNPWTPGIQAVGYLTLPTDTDPEAPTFELPVVTGPGIDDRWLRDQPSFIPEDVRLDWERSGFEVESQRRLVSVQLDDDGRYLTIPVDEVLLRSVDRRTY